MIVDSGYCVMYGLTLNRYAFGRSLDVMCYDGSPNFLNVEH